MSNWAELTSLATALEDMTRRIAEMADEANRAKDEGVAADLFEVERGLRATARRLSKLADARSL